MVGFAVLSALLSPPRCAACDEPTSASAVLCVACAATVERSNDPHAPFVYGGAIATALTRFKYENVPELARPLGALLAAAAVKLVRDVDIVVPVPLHPDKLIERGFNQAALLAFPVARALGLPFRARVLERIRVTSQQATLDRNGRKRNVDGAFRAKNTAFERVLLVDDVRTTGATQEACAFALRQAGCPLVRCLALAIAPAIA